MAPALAVNLPACDACFEQCDMTSSRPTNLATGGRLAVELAELAHKLTTKINWNHII